jgi:hypothetical protein
MAGNPRHDSPGHEPGARGFIKRWSARKRDAALRTEAPSQPAAPVTPAPDAERGPNRLTDRDMPPLESLNEESDYSGFLSAGVSEALQRRALRRLFGATKFNLRDGLDDYDTDYNRLLTLRRVIPGATQDVLAQGDPEPRVRRTTGSKAVSDEEAVAESEVRPLAPGGAPATQQEGETRAPADDGECTAT